MSEQGAPDVASQLRLLRKRRGLSLRTLAELCDLSPNTISLIERGESSPSVSTLHRLATALAVPITAFFEEQAEPVHAVLTRAGERHRSGNAHVLLESLGTGLAEQALQPFMVTMEPGANSGPQPIVHGGQELVFCIQGDLEYEVAGRPYRLAGGDALLFDARLPHRWSNPGTHPTAFLLVFGEAGASQPAEQHLRA
ncbi:MAG TPA: cupin domain-containing protein [Anaerolineae bacterium]|nr:cupin domain-containing protein [Anaerolineae bacterium]